MRFKKYAPLLLGTLMAGLISLGPVAMMADTTTVVKPSMMDGWRFRTAGGTLTSTVGFDSSGPGVPPAGSTSSHFTTGSDTSSFAEFRNIDYNGQSLSGLTALTYSTYVTTKAPGACVAGFILLSVDVDGNGVFDPGGGPDDGIFFEPCYQTGAYVTDPPGQIIPAQNGGLVLDSAWQTWDALAGGWWSAKYGGLGGPPLTLLSNYIAKLASMNFPNPKIVNSDACLGGVRVRAGEGEAWLNFEGNVDKLTIGIGGVNTTYDFEYEPLPIPGCGATQATVITAGKFYDTNANGVLDPADLPLNGWPITISPLGAATPNQATQLTAGGGTVSWGNLDPALNPYTVTEGTPIQSNWFHSTPASVNLNVVTNQTGSVDFGNYCKAGSGGKTLGFWSNKNGQAILQANDPAWRTLVNGCCLRKADGSIYSVPGGSFGSAYSNFKNWLLDASAKNMAYMLSAQLVTMKLNVAFGGVNGGAFDLCSHQTINDLTIAANAALCADGSTPTGDPNRAAQETLKNCLDALNNGALVIPATPCTYSFGLSVQASSVPAAASSSPATVRMGGRVIYP